MYKAVLSTEENYLKLEYFGCVKVCNTNASNMLGFFFLVLRGLQSCKENKAVREIIYSITGLFPNREI